jgi:tetratricopeptide (TPR) repeat protein
MKKILLAMLLAATATTVAQTTPAPSQTPAAPATTSQPAPAAGAAQQTPAPAAAPQQKKEIKDPAEYNAYVGALGQSDPNAKISGFEAFLTQYPNSVMKEEALEQLMAAYQATNNGQKMIESAQKILTVNPNNLKALVVLVFAKRATAKTPQDLTEAAGYAEKGLAILPTWPKPDGMAEADYQKFKTQATTLFNGAIGIAAYQNKDNAKAAQYLRAAVDSDPTDVNNIYPLALVYLTPGPSEKDVDGLFYIARAANLIQDPKGKADVIKFGHSKYLKYHGAEDGWNELLAKAATATSPEGTTITQYVPPTPAQQCTDLLKSKKIEEMSFAEWELCLSEGTPEDAEKVWTTLKGKPLQMVAHIISVDSPSNLKLAGSQDDIDVKRADIDLSFAAAIPARQLPKVDTDLQFEGTPVSYEAKPFVMTMKEGALLVKAAPKKPTAPVRKKPAAH